MSIYTELPPVFLDANVTGTVQTARLLRAAFHPLRVEAFDDHFDRKHGDEGGTDEKWLTLCAEQGWLGLTFDKMKRRGRPLARRICQRHGGRVVLLPFTGEASEHIAVVVATVDLLARNTQVLNPPVWIRIEATNPKTAGQLPRAKMHVQPGFRQDEEFCVPSDAASPRDAGLQQRYRTVLPALDYVSSKQREKAEVARRRIAENRARRASQRGRRRRR